MIEVLSYILFMAGVPIIGMLPVVYLMFRSVEGMNMNKPFSKTIFGRLKK